MDISILHVYFHNLFDDLTFLLVARTFFLWAEVDIFGEVLILYIADRPSYLRTKDGLLPSSIQCFAT